MVSFSNISALAQWLAHHFSEKKFNQSTLTQLGYEKFEQILKKLKNQMGNIPVGRKNIENFADKVWDQVDKDLMIESEYLNQRGQILDKLVL